MGVGLRNSLTTSERIAVELKTKGETSVCRQFPPEVVAAWLTAEVVRAEGAPHRQPVTRARSLRSLLLSRPLA